jgi:hypothetical protein
MPSVLASTSSGKLWNPHKPDHSGAISGTNSIPLTNRQVRQRPNGWHLINVIDGAVIRSHFSLYNQMSYQIWLFESHFIQFELKLLKL